MRDQADYRQGIADGLAGNPYAGNLPGVRNRSYGDGFDEDFIMRRNREDAVTLPETMGDRIRALRRGRRLSLDRLAKAAGCSKSYLWGLETEVSPRPSANKLSGIAAVLGVTIDHLVHGRLRPACYGDDARRMPGSRVERNPRLAVVARLQRVGRDHGGPDGTGDPGHRRPEAGGLKGRGRREWS